MKLFVWDNSKPYVTEVYFALATSVEQARALVTAQTGKWVRHTLKDSPAVYDSPVGFEVSHSG